MADTMVLKNTFESLLIGSNIKKWRAVKEIKQDLLAQKIKVTPAHLSKIENGKVTISMAKLEEIAKNLDVEVNDLTSNNFNYTNILNSPHANANNNNVNSTYCLNDTLLQEKLIETLNKLLEKLS